MTQQRTDPWHAPRSPRPRIRADVFPATVTVAPPDPDSPSASTLTHPLPPTHRRLEKVRVVVTLDQVLIFEDSSQGPQLIFSERLQDYTPPPKRGQTIRTMHAPREATLLTDSGKTLAFSRSAGCGCGSQLKSFNPFSTTTSYSLAAQSDL